MNGQWFCEKCARSFDNVSNENRSVCIMFCVLILIELSLQCIRRYILSCTMADTTGSAWFTIFNDHAEKLLMASAQQLFDFKSSGNEAAYEKAFADALFKTCICKVRVKQELVNDEMRTKNTVLKVDDLDVVAECKQMLDAIKAYQ